MMLSKWLGYFSALSVEHRKRRSKYDQSPDWQLLCCIDDIAIMGERLSSLSDSFYSFIDIADQLQPPLAEMIER